MNPTLPQGYSITTDKSLLDINVIHCYLSKESYWAKDIPMEVVQKSIDNAVCFGVYFQSHQVGFARVVTDKSTFAYLADVFILYPHRNKGLSKRLMEVLMAHEDLQGLRRWMLATRDAHSLYAQYGWQPLSNPDRLMQIVNQDIYH